MIKSYFEKLRRKAALKKIYKLIDRMTVEQLQYVVDRIGKSDR